MARGRQAPPRPAPRKGPPQLNPEEQADMAAKLAEVAKIPVSDAEARLAQFLAGPQSAEHRLLTRLNARLAGAVFTQDKP